MNPSCLPRDNENLQITPELHAGDATAFNPTDLRGQLRQNEPMSKHTSWRVGGLAQWFYEPADSTDLAHFMRQLPVKMPVFWLGLGSNLLVRDAGIRGVVILTAGLLDEIKLLDKERVYVEAGVSCAKLARFAARSGLTGTEFLAGIPGTVGGALAMNASAWGGETWPLVREVKTLNRQGQFYDRTAADYQIGYRSVKGPNDEWFIATTLQLNPNQGEPGQAKIRILLDKRNKNQPIGVASGGSVFRNPPGDFAGRLIEQAGWKGRCVGGACVSEQHANFIINKTEATAADIENLIEQITVSVEQTYHIHLVLEVHIVGELKINN